MSLPVHSNSLPHAREPLLSSLNDLEGAGDASDPHFSRRSLHLDNEGWVKIPYVLVLKCSLALAGLVLLVFAGIASLRGLKSYNDLTRPHRAIHASAASAKDGANVVRPFFSPDKNAEVKLAVSVWFREGTPLQLPKSDEQRWMYSYNEVWRKEVGEQGFVQPELGKQNDWEQVWSREELPGHVRSTRRDDIQIKLPGRIVHSLATNNQSRLVATFALLPSSLSSPHTGATYEHTSTRPVRDYGASSPWPLAFPIAESDPRSAFLSHSATGVDLIRQEEYYDFNFTDQHHSIPMDRHDEFLNSRRFVPFLKSRLFVTMADDYAVYELASFKKAMRDLRTIKDRCPHEGYYGYNSCMRLFSNDGHFENLLELKSQTGSESFYGPFLTTRMSPHAPMDYVRLPKNKDIGSMKPAEVQDFTFDWHLTYLALGAAKLTFVNDRGSWEDLLGTSSRSAKLQDELELHSAYLGLSFNPQSHPIARGILGALAKGLRYLALPFILHYWATRFVSTGISILVLTLQSVTDLIYFIVIWALSMDSPRLPVFLFVLAIVTFVLLILKQIHLAFRLEWVLGTIHLRERKLGKVTVESFGIPGPEAVRMRTATRAETRSFDLDRRFPWALKLLIFALTFIIFRFSPPAPAIVPAPKYADVMHGFGGAIDENQTRLMVRHILGSFQSSVWLTSQLSQIHLNYRSGTFAGSYGIATYLIFGSIVLSHVSSVFSRWLGRSYLMQPFTLWDLVTILVQGALVVQARKLPRVVQEDGGSAVVFEME